MSSSFVIRATLMIHLILVLGLVASSHDGGRWAHGVDLQKRVSIAFKQGDHLFNDVEKAVTEMIYEVFSKTNLRKYVKATIVEKGLLLESIIDNEDLGAQFKLTIATYNTLVKNLLSDNERKQLVVHGVKKLGPDENAKIWLKYHGRLFKELPFSFVSKLFLCDKL
jgi:hypothetical protein